MYVSFSFYAVTNGYYLTIWVQPNWKQYHGAVNMDLPMLLENTIL